MGFGGSSKPLYKVVIYTELCDKMFFGVCCREEMAAGAVAVPTIVPLRPPVAGQHKTAVDTGTKIELHSGKFIYLAKLTHPIGLRKRQLNSEHRHADVLSKAQIPTKCHLSLKLPCRENCGHKS